MAIGGNLRKVANAAKGVVGGQTVTVASPASVPQRSVDEQMNAAWGYDYSAPAEISDMSLDEQVAASELLTGLTGNVYQPDGVAPLQDLYGQQARRAEVDAIDARYGSDLSWLDPTFQAQTALLGQSQAAGARADPNMVAAQQGILDATLRTGSSPIAWEGAGRQQGVFDAYGQLEAPDWSGSDARQQQAYDEIGSSYNPQFMSDAQQRQSLGAIRANNSGQQQDAYGRIAGNNSGQQQEWLGKIGANNSNQQQQWLGKIGDNNSDQQNDVYDDLTSITNSGGTEGLDWDRGERQGEQYDYLQEIVGGRGATEIEMANRQAQRADQEQWLRSQREADMQDYAERGLTGSGQELLALGQDRQAAAGRNSLADLQTAAQLEDRRLQAIGMSGDLAGVMRGQTNDQERFEAERSDSALGQRGQMATAIRGMDLDRDIAGGALSSQIRGMDLDRDVAGGALSSQIRGMDLSRDQSLGDLATQIRGLDLDRDVAAGNMTNAMRDDTYNEQSFLATNDLNRALGRGDLATQMRAGDYSEKSFNAGYALDVLNNQGNMANAMRDDTYNEQSYTRDSQLRALQQSGQLSTDMRGASFDEAYKTGRAADDFSVINTAAINSTNQGNTAFLQDAYMQTQRQRQQAYLTTLGIQADTAIAGAQLDQRDNQAGFDQASSIGRFDTNAVNSAINARNAAAAGTYAPPAPAAPNTADIYGTAGSAVGGALDRSAQAKGGAPVGGAPTAGSGFAGNAGNPSGQVLTQNPTTVDYSKRYGQY